VSNAGIGLPKTVQGTPKRITSESKGENISVDFGTEEAFATCCGVNLAGE
jgi:hypothetical protein